ncbi:MAG: hypothetical protein AAF664_14195 [Planctomycetota bacterium]
MAPTTPTEPLWESENPYQASAQTDLTPPIALTKRHRYRGLIAILVIIQCLVLIGGLIGERIEHESIVVSGALLLISSILLFVVAQRRQLRGVGVLGLLGALFPLGIFLRIYLGELSPTESEKQHWVIIQTIGAILLVGQTYLAARHRLRNKAIYGPDLVD